MNDKGLVIVKKNIAAEIKRLRGSMDQASFAEKCQTSQPCICRWEKGNGIPAVESLIDVSNGCGIKLSTLIEKAVAGLPAWKLEPKATKPTIKKTTAKPAKNPVDKAAKKATAKAAALDAPDLPATKRSHSKKIVPVVVEPAPESAPAEVVND